MPSLASDKVLRDLGWQPIHERLLSHCQSAAARRQLARPEASESTEALNTLLDRVGEARSLEERGTALSLEGVCDIDEALTRVEKGGTLTGEQLRAVASTLRISDRLRRSCNQQDAPKLAQLARRLTPLPDTWGPILDAFDVDGTLADHASKALSAARKEVRTLADRVSRRMRELITRPDIARHLQDRFYTQRESRYVLPIRTESAAFVSGIVFGSSDSGATVFVEPHEVIELNNRLKVAQVEAIREEQRVYEALTAYLRDDLPSISDNVVLLAQLDGIIARARLARQLKGSRPAVSEDGTLELRDLRHPTMVLQQQAVVANHLRLDAGQALIISGPNAGGKTVTLKAVGLCALMLRAGLELPVSAGSRLPLYRAILSDIDDDQSLERNLSTFTAHISHVVDYLERTDRRTLVLLDEVSTGTDPVEGEALAVAVIEALRERAGHVLVTTHYERLKTIGATDKGYVNASVGFDVERLAPTYRLTRGQPGSSYAMAIAERVGLARPLVDRARELLSAEQVNLASLLSDLARQRRQFQQAQQALVQARAELDKREADRSAQQEAQQQRSQRQLQAAHETALEELKSSRQRLREIQARLPKMRRREDLRQADKAISAEALTLGKYRRSPEPSPGRTPEGHEIKPGRRFYVPKWNGIAEVIEPGEEGRVLVQLGSLRAELPAEELRELSAKARRMVTGPATVPPSPAYTLNAPPVASSELTFDARGMRVVDALEALEQFLDRCLLAGHDVVFVLHGHGSGALRRALRERLAELPMVGGVRAGRKNEGGDAITVVALR